MGFHILCRIRCQLYHAVYRPWVSVYPPLVLHEYWMPLTFAGLLMLKGFLLGIDHKFGDPATRIWKYNILMNVITQFVVSWMLVPALLQRRNNKWGTM